MPKFVVEMSETRVYDVPVEADTPAEAIAKAHQVWQKADTVGQWELPHTDVTATDVRPL